MKRASFFLIALIMCIEIGAIFLPKGPLNTTLKYIRIVRETTSKGSYPCLVCGAPAVPTTYVFPKQIITKYCQKHTPEEIRLYTNFFNRMRNHLLYIWIWMTFMAYANFSALQDIKEQLLRKTQIIESLSRREKFLLLMRTSVVDLGSILGCFAFYLLGLVGFFYISFFVL